MCVSLYIYIYVCMYLFVDRFTHAYSHAARDCVASRLGSREKLQVRLDFWNQSVSDYMVLNQFICNF